PPILSKTTSGFCMKADRSCPPWIRTMKPYVIDLSGIDVYIIGDTKMFGVNLLFFLRIALVVIGLTFIFGIYTLGILWPSGWVWGQVHSQHYLMMIIGVYATLGVFLLFASRNPYAHKSLIWFTVWSSAVHGAIMGVQAL